MNSNCSTTEKVFLTGNTKVTQATVIGSRDLVLYLDYDGVLHHCDVHCFPPDMPVLAGPDRYTLFQHAALLEQLLTPYPAVQIVLSTTWAWRQGFHAATARLPPGLRARVIGSTFSASIKYLDDFASMPRGWQVVEDAKKRKPDDWIALDDDSDGWPREYRSHLVKTHQYEGINMPGVIKKLNAKLAEMHK